jgi:hypothetical protein
MRMMIGGFGSIGYFSTHFVVRPHHSTAKALDKIADGAKVVDKIRDVASTAKQISNACGLCFTARQRLVHPVEWRITYATDLSKTQSGWLLSSHIELVINFSALFSAG